MEDIFKKEGSLLEVSGNTPFLLNESDSVWFVDAGNVDLFAVQVENGKPSGPRSHIFRAETGQTVIGMKQDGYGKGIGLLAAGATNTRLFKLSQTRLKEVAREPVYADSINSLIHHWVTGLSLGVRKGLLPKTFIELESGREAAVDDGQDARPAKGTFWVRHLEGSSRFMGRDDWPLLDEDLFYPISEQTWLQSIGESKLEVLETQAFIQQDFFWVSLERFHRLILDCLIETIQESQAQERHRLREKTAEDHAVFKNALSGIVSVLEPEKAAPAEVAGDRLLAACKIIGQKLNIEFRSPPKETMGREPLDAVIRASRVRKRKVILKDEWWRRDNGPLLAYMMEDKRPVALLPVSSRSYELHDPGMKDRKKVTLEVANSLDPFAYTFYRPFPDHALKGWDLFKQALFDCKKDLVMIFIMGIAGAVLGLFTPIATGIIFNMVIPEAAHSQLLQITLILLTCAIVMMVFEITRGIATLRFEAKADSSIQAGVMDRLLSLPVPFFRTYTAGDLAERTLGINKIREILSGVTIQAIMAGVFSSFNFVLMFWYDSKLALVTTGIVLISIIFTGIATYLQVRYQRTLFMIQGKISGMILQFITGISKLRVSGTEDRAFAVWAEEFRKQKRIAYRSGTVANILSAFNSSFPILAMMAIFAWVAARSMGLLSTGNFLAFNAAYNNFQNALLQMVVAFTAVLNVVPLYERAKPIIETSPEVDVTKASPKELTGDIEVRHVIFRYTPDGPLIVKDVSLEIRPGEFVALVGGSGSGKSTLFRLLLGFETPESGTIYYDGNDLSTLDIQEVRRQVGVVLQNGKIMPGGIFNNIVGASNLTMDDAWEAARMAGLDEDIKQMPMGMNTVLSPGGGTVSGGQRQRLLIARAIVHKPRILFFDEATSALDNKTQAIVSRSLEKLQATRVVIAHRLSTINKADRIFVLDKGLLVQSGAYDELMKQEGLFAELAKRQIA